MEVTRRDTMVIGGAAALTTILPSLSSAAIPVNELIMGVTGGADAATSGIDLTAPEIAENGNQVKVSFDIESPMTEEDFVKTVYILADGNPAPNVAKFSFTTDMGACSATTRMRLSKTQNIYLLAEYNNGNFAMTKSKVKVTIGGCGG